MTEHLLSRRIEFRDQALVIGRNDRVQRSGEHGALARLALAQRFFGQHAIGDVAYEGLKSKQFGAAAHHAHA